jgi:hypothetical protein
MLAARILAVPAVAVLVLVGIWVTGGLITDDFTVSMWLTAAWMGLAGLACVAVAVRSRAFRWPVLGAYAVTAGVAGAYLGSSVFLDKEVDERVATAAPPAAAERRMAVMGSPEMPAAPRNVLLRAGRFESVRHPASGDAEVIGLARGGRVLTLTDFEVDNGPDLRVRLAAGPATSEDDTGDVVDLGALKGNKGDQQYEIPGGVDVTRQATVIIWCRAFSVLFARAPLSRTPR